MLYSAVVSVDEYILPSEIAARCRRVLSCNRLRRCTTLEVVAEARLPLYDPGTGLLLARDTGTNHVDPIDDIKNKHREKSDPLIGR